MSHDEATVERAQSLLSARPDVIEKLIVGGGWASWSPVTFAAA